LNPVVGLLLVGCLNSQGCSSMGFKLDWEVVGATICGEKAGAFKAWALIFGPVGPSVVEQGPAGFRDGLLV